MNIDFDNASFCAGIIAAYAVPLIAYLIGYSLAWLWYEVIKK
jgi:hypothetical protein